MNDKLDTLQNAIRDLFVALGGNIDNVRDEQDVNDLIRALGTLQLGGGGSELPEVTVEDNGDVLTVVSGEWAKAAPSGGGGVLIVTDTEGTLDKTWAEINAAAPLAWIFDDGGYLPIGACFSEDGEYYVSFIEFADTVVFHDYSASSESAYPTRST